MNAQYTLVAIISQMVTRTALLVTTLVASQHLHAEACDHYKEDVSYYENLLRHGGNADEMNRWRAIEHELEDKYSHCKNDNKAVVQTVSGDNPQSTYVPVNQERKPLRHISLKDDEQLQRLTKTCNYWIETTNEDPTQDNSNFRDTACRAVDNYGNGQTNSNSPTSNSPVDAMPVRKLKDCIKPHNLIDHEVNECVKGNIEPTWKKQ